MVDALSYTFDMRPTRTRLPGLVRLSSLLIPLVLLAAACGGDGEATVDSVPPTSVPPTTTASSTTVALTTSSTTEEPRLVGTPAFDESSSVSTVGIDEVTFGMGVVQAERAIGSELVNLVESFDIECYQVRPTGGPAGLEFTVTAGTIERVDVSTEVIKTRSGAGLGMTEDELFALFPERLTTAPRPGGGNTLTFTPRDATDAQFRVIFESDGEVVTSFRSGRVPQVETLVPCGPAS